MRSSNRLASVARLILVVLVLSTSNLASGGEVVDLEFKPPSVQTDDPSQVDWSIAKIRAPAGSCQNALYLTAHLGDLGPAFAQANREAIENPMICETWRFCSVFAGEDDHGSIVGRNWDNQNVGSVIVSLYKPPAGYASISFSRAIDLGYPLNLDLEQIAGNALGANLQLAPFYAMDGVNERGLAVAVAGVSQVKHAPSLDGDRIFVTNLVRKLLDQARDVPSAVVLVRDHVPFDLDRNTLNTHFLVADADGRSVVLEYMQGEWHPTYSDGPWQAMTNKVVHEVPDTVLRDKCWRYERLAASLDATSTELGWRTGMEILNAVKQEGTTWSAVYCPSRLEVYFCVYQDWETVYRLTPFE